MSRNRKILKRILAGRSDAAVRFNELRYLLHRLGFIERIRGSHHVFVRSDIAERIILQRDGAHAKPYQVRRVRGMILRNGLGIEE